MPVSFLTSLRRRVRSIPPSSGVYRWLDAKGNVLYVGKAKQLKNRMQTYVQAGAKHSPWTAIMVRQIADFDITVTNSELEALMLEANLIKELRPKYNILLKDDKNYVYVKVTTQDTFPRIDVVRQMDNDGATYFGPKTSALEVRESLAFLRTLFPFRNCKMAIETVNSEQLTINKAAKGPQEPTILNGVIPIDVVCKDRDRPTPCVDYHIKQCSAPCIGLIDPVQYRALAIDGVLSFFRGKYQEVEAKLVQRMKEAAAANKFEIAARLRDQLARMKKMQEHQIISDTSGANSDTIGAALLSGHAFIVLLKERDGKLIGEESFALQGTAENLSDVLEQFLPQYYAGVSDLPDMIVVGEAPSDRTAIDEWLKNLRGKKIRLHVPERGKKSKLLLLAEKNADSKVRQSEAKWESEVRKVEAAQKELADLLGLSAIPRRIEGYDISHLGGTATVGSMVVFVNGKPKREHYRSFNIRSLKEGDVDDYKALAEALKRRLKYLTLDLKKEELALKVAEILVHKGRKEDQTPLEAFVKSHEDQVDPEKIVAKDFLIAEKGKKIVGCVRLKIYKDTTVELATLFIEESFRGVGLGQFLVRKLLGGIKKGKVYLITKTTLEEFYANIGFRPIREMPEALHPKVAICEKLHCNGGVMFMMFDVTKQKPDESFLSMPDLILVDGGKGQLAACTKILEELKLTIPIAGLAKREEEIFLPPPPPAPPPGSAEQPVEGGSSAHSEGPLAVPKDSEARFLLQRIRDEAHRFANAKREKRLESALLSSAMDGVKGIGPKKKAEGLKGKVRGQQEQKN
ncbi:MAG: GNAT family N-acetyltransferase [Candidatus Peribacteraceae bacterium]|nr:GNAT family N-acetyltransferase [Candidatus Peribacteraceae bacterium]